MENDYDLPPDVNYEIYIRGFCFMRITTISHPAAGLDGWLDIKGTERSDRYIGYMGETLETLYFMKNAGRLNIVHAGCRLMV